MTHKINHGWTPDRTDPAWAERVEREATRHTASREVAYQKAQRRLQRAEERLARVRDALPQPHMTTRALAVAEAIVELRRQELIEIQRLMSGAPASAAHRTRGQAHRPVPNQATI